ncbi:MAG: export transporter permease protein [Bacteroidetes bacterium]|jgi:putative ABC transport system permease protein|nr:export transporter permease protein [Bacteroidota bacterium]
MKILNIVLSAFRALHRNKMRSFLTMLGIIIGVAAVIAMLAIGQGAEYSVEQQITALGTNVLIVLPGSQNTSGLRQAAGTMTNLTEEDAQAIMHECPAVSLLSPGTRSGGQIIAGNLNWAAGIEGTGPDYLEIRKWGIEYGEFYTEQDVKGAAKVCVLGKTVADNLFPESSPVGQNVRIRNVPFKVIGVLTKKGQNAMGQDQDDVVLAPYTTVTRRLTWYPYLRQILVSATSPANIPVAQKQITELLRMRHKIAPYDSDDFTIRNQADLASAATATTEILTILLASIASVSLLVGGIGIMNIMLVSVTERTREIGIRMSVGARGRDILTQFLIEALVLSLLGGITGIILGVGGSTAISAFAKWPTIITAFSIVLSFGFSIAIGIFFGFYPARKAAMLNPIDALRYE